MKNWQLAYLLLLLAVGAARKVYRSLENVIGSALVASR